VGSWGFRAHEEFMGNELWAWKTMRRSLETLPEHQQPFHNEQWVTGAAEGLAHTGYSWRAGSVGPTN